MKHTKMIPKYEAEINKLAEEHLMALLKEEIEKIP